MTQPFDTILMVDWSARSKPSPKKPTKDAIFIGRVKSRKTEVTYHRTRADTVRAIQQEFDQALAENRRVLAGFDFPFGYPKGFAKAVAGRASALALWEWLAARVEDEDDNSNNRFDIAEALNQRFPGVGPFWGCPPGRATRDLPMKGSERSGHGLPERRQVEVLLPRAQSCWKLFTTGSVGSQVLLGLPRLQSLRVKYGRQMAVAPFDTHDAPIVLAEIYPSLLDLEVRARQQEGEILDAAQVRVLAEAFFGLPAERLPKMLSEGDPEEGWILGLGYEDELVAGLG